MTQTAELKRRALLHRQAAQLLREEADRHLKDAQRLECEAERLKGGQDVSESAL